MHSTEPLGRSSKTASPKGVLSPQDFGNPVSRRPQFRAKGEPTSPKSSLPRPRTLPKVTSNLESGAPVQEPLPVPSSVRVATWCNAVGPCSSAQNFNSAPTRTAQCTRTLSSDTFGRRDSTTEDSPYPSRHFEDEDSVEMRQSMSASTYESDHEKFSLSCEQSSAAGDYNASETTPATPQTAAWRKEADEEWEARFDKKFRSPSQHLSPRASLLDTANIVFETGSSPKGTTAASTSTVPLFKVHNPFTDRTATKEMKVAGSAGVPGTSSPYFASHDHWRRSLPQNTDSGPSHPEAWNAWKSFGERPRRSTGGSSRGHPDAVESTTSRNNSMVSSTSSSSRGALTHRTSNSNFLAGLLGRELSSHSTTSTEASGSAAGHVMPKTDLKHLFRRNPKLSRPPSSEGLGQMGKYNATERCEGKGSPLKTAFPLPQESARNTLPAKAKRRMSMPSRQAQNASMVYNGMVTSFGGEPADLGLPKARRDRATSVHRYASGQSSSSAMPSPIEERLCSQGDSVAKPRSQMSVRSPVFSNGSSAHRPRSRSDAEVHCSETLTNPQNSPSVLRRVFVSPVQMDPHDEEQHTASEVSADEEIGEAEQTVGNNGHDLPQIHREASNETSRKPQPPVPALPIELALPPQVMEPSRLAAGEKEEATVMSRSSSSRSSRTKASAGALLSPTKLLRRLASRDGLSSNSRGQGLSLDASHYGNYSPSKQTRPSKPEGQTTLNRSPANSTSASHSAQKSSEIPLPRRKTAPAEPERTPRSRRPSLVWTGHTTSVLPNGTEQHATANATPSLEAAPAGSDSPTGQDPSPSQMGVPSSLGLYMMPSQGLGTPSDVPALDSTSSSDSASWECSPDSATSTGLPSPFSPMNETRMAQPALTTEAGASDEGVMSASPRYHPPTQSQSPYQRRRSATLPAAPGASSPAPDSICLDLDCKRADTTQTRTMGLSDIGSVLGADVSPELSSSSQPVSPSKQAFRAPMPPRPPRRNVAGSGSPSYFGLAGAAPSGYLAMTPPSPATQSGLVLGPATAKSLHGWEQQGQVSGGGVNQSGSPGKTSSTARARIEKFFGGGMSSGNRNVHKGSLAP